MTYDAEKKKFGRLPAKVVEFDLDYCTRTYGVAPCAAAVGVTGTRKCFNTRKTCQDPTNYAPASKLYRFSDRILDLPIISDTGPLVNAGLDQTIDAGSTLLSATVSSALAYTIAWSVVSGVGSISSGGTTPAPTVNVGLDQSVVFRITVTDSLGQSAHDDVTVTGGVVGNLSAISADGRIYAYAADYNLLYMGGNFANVTDANGSHARGGLACLDLETCLFTSWNPGASGGGHVIYALAVDASHRVYAGGDYSTLGGSGAGGIGRITAAGARDATFTGTTNAIVNVIRLDESNDAVYAGGNFTSPKAYLARFALSTGAVVSSFDALITAGGASIPQVVDLLVSANGLYVAGIVGGFNGVTRNDLALVDPATGVLVAGFAPSGPSPASYDVSCLILVGTTLYTGGQYPTMGGSPRSNLSAVNALTGALLTWDPSANGSVRAMAYANGKIYSGGGYSTLSSVSRHGGASDPTTAALDSFDPQFDGAIRCFYFTANRVFTGGDFTHSGASPRAHFAVFNAAGALL